MAKTTKVAQKKWLKGINAASQPFAQPPGSFPRGSNVIYIRRGSLTTCDGSLTISAYQGAVLPFAANFGFFADIFLYEPIGAPSSYFAILKGKNVHMPAISTLAVVAGAAGILNGTFHWVVTALDGNGGETTASNEVTLTPANQKASLTWTASPGALGYNVYRTVLGGAVGTEKFVATVTTNSFLDNTPDGSLTSQVPPLVNSSQTTLFWNIPVTSYSGTNAIFTFPAIGGDLAAKDRTGGGYGGGGGTGSGGFTSGNQGPTAAGGILGLLSPIPQILQFKDLMILILGNGITPYTSDGTFANTIPVVNNFQASYGARVASTAQNVGDQISATVGGTAYIFTCNQSGTTSSGGAPAFSAIEGSIVVDGTVYWKNTGRVNAVTPPRGAAHGIVYAGSLWIGNTSPTTTSDNFDGPSCVKMSDLNNPNSWNPLNVAFLDRDDGTQITGFATFTIAESGIPPVGSLVAFKDFSTFQINGVFGASNFSIARAQTDMGCVAGRTIQFVPGFGIVRLTHLGFAIFDGVRDRLISEEIRPYLFGGQDDIAAIDWTFVYFSKGSQTAQPPMYICACSLLQTAQPLTETIKLTSTAGAGTGWNLPTSSWAFIVQLVKNDGTLYNSQEMFLTLDGSHSPRFTISGFTQNDLLTGFKWRVYYGNSPGGENKYQDVPFGATFTLANPASGNSGLVNSSQGALTRIFCYDLVLKAWTIIDLPYQISALKQIRASGTIPITVVGGFYDGILRRWLGGAGLDVTWDEGAINNGAPDANVRWSFRTPEVFGKDASDRVYFRQLMIRGRGSPTGMTAALTINGAMSATTFSRNFTVTPMGGGEFVAYVDIGVTGVDAYATIAGAGPIDIQSVDWAAVPKAIGSRVAV